MIDPQTLKLLFGILLRESCSRLQYMGDAFPWTTSEDAPIVDQIKTLAAEEKALLTRIGQFLFRHRVPVTNAGQFPSSFTTMNFLALDHLLPLLVTTEDQALADLRATLPKMPEGEARDLVDKLLTLKQRNLKKLQDLHAAPASKVAS